jgi:hypothetical protein
MVTRERGQWGFVILWEYQVRGGMEKSFEKVYKPDGDWALLFIQDQAYIGTELIHNLKSTRTYVTLDFWVSRAACDAFLEQHSAEYKALDEKCELMTESEREIGRFERVGG